jgi:hypothetical protein
LPLGELVKRRVDERYQNFRTEELTKKLAIRQPNVEKHAKDKELKDKAKAKVKVAPIPPMRSHWIFL